jgi:hypothetical protein
MVLLPDADIDAEDQSKECFFFLFQFFKQIFNFRTICTQDKTRVAALCKVAPEGLKNLGEQFG